MGGHWAEADVSMLTSKLLIQGEAAGQFTPEGHISRAEFAALLVRALNVPTGTSEAFTDVNGSEWYAGVVAAAAKAGLISGFEDGSFRPNGSLTREQAAVMVIRALQLAGQKPSAQGEGLSRFTSDGSEISPFAQQAVADAVNTGILNGLTDSAFGPQDTTTRAEAAVMLKRLLQVIGFIQS
ncbi:S-layer homology domain-containing protein [Paenibacillus oryzisoli]|uniref:S-layer homology domain-containing protein n=1 Tax=Paenibacillus oryzisoli TaxID=1850517 RepID=UPI003D2B6AF4